MTQQSTCSPTFFARRQKPLMIAASVYVVFLVLSHATLPAAHVWVIAATFSILMNFTYITEAAASGRYLSIEALIASLLILASIAGVFISPLLVILAILGHGCWDLAKHFGAGVPFFFWYTCSCFICDTIYGASLLFYWLSLT